jgi:hypothetical protein
MKEDFIKTNEERKEMNKEKKKYEIEEKMKERYEHFPYTGSDQVEERRRQLKLNQKKEFQQYLLSDPFKQS